MDGQETPQQRMQSDCFMDQEQAPKSETCCQVKNRQIQHPPCNSGKSHRFLCLGPSWMNTSNLPTHWLIPERAISQLTRWLDPAVVGSRNVLKINPRFSRPNALQASRGWWLNCSLLARENNQLATPMINKVTQPTKNK